MVAACSVVSGPGRLRRCPLSAGSLDTTCARCGGDGALAWRVTHTEFAIMLRIYPVVLELVRRLSPYLSVLRVRSSALGDQLERALISIPLNLAEGAYSRGKNRQGAISPQRLRRARCSLVSRLRKRSAGFSRWSRSSELSSSRSSALWCGSSNRGVEAPPVGGLASKRARPPGLEASSTAGAGHERYPGHLLAPLGALWRRALSAQALAAGLPKPRLSAKSSMAVAATCEVS